MHGQVDDRPRTLSAATDNKFVAAADRLLDGVNFLIAVFAAIAMILACIVLSYSVATRALFHSATYWQDEAAVFLLVGATFMTAAYVQSKRGHIGIEAFTGLLSPAANRARLIAVDIATFVFCVFFSWKSWTLTHEAWVDSTVSNSTWGPPLVIPYFLMSLGMTLLCVQVLLQIVGALGRIRQS